MVPCSLRALRWHRAGSAVACHAAFEALQAAWLDFMPRAEAPLDVTSLLLNAGLAVLTRDGLFYDNLTHWRTDANGGNLRILAIDGSDARRGEAKGANMIERWAGVNFYAGERLLFQSLPSVPLGRYVFRAAAQKDAGGGAIYLFANEDTAAVTGVKELAGVEVATDVTDGTLTVGLLAGSGNATRWVSMADLALEYRSPLVLVGEALADAALLDYGTDAGGMLQSAVSAARQAQASGSPDGCMEACRLLVAACGKYRIDNASVAHPVDMTARVCNAGFDASNALGWTLAEVADPAFPKFARGTMEFWHTPFDIRQTLTGLPAGYYLVGLQARSDKGGSNSIFRFYARAGADGEISAYPTGVARADGTDASLHLGQNADDLNADPAVDRTVLRVFVDDGTLTLGAACTGNDVWCVMNGFTLEYVGDGTLALDENDTDYVLTGDAVAEKVTVARKLKADGRWNTFCVPFGMTAEQLDANRVTSLKRLAGAETEGTSVTLRFEDAEEVEAGVPYLLRVSEAVDTLVVEHVTVEAENPENRAIRMDGVIMTGNYSATTVPLGAYFISDNAFYLADYEGVSLKGFRAYITLDGLAQANRLFIDVGGGTTGVDGLQAVEADPLVDVYTMEGRRVKRGVRKSAALDGLPRGVYVVGGEKVAR